MHGATIRFIVEYVEGSVGLVANTFDLIDDRHEGYDELKESKCVNQTAF